MQRTAKKALRFSTDTLERYRARYPNESPSRQLRSPATADAEELKSSIVESSAAKSTTATASAVITTSAKEIMPAATAAADGSTPLNRLRDQISGQELQSLDRRDQNSHDFVSIYSKRTQESCGPATTIAKGVTKATPSVVTTETQHLEQTTATTSVSNQRASNGTATTRTSENKQNSGSYVNWTSSHTTLASYAWVAMSDLMYFCDKYEFKSLSARDSKTHQQIQAEVRALLTGKAPFGQRQRFPSDIRDPENLWVCIGRCAGVEYHLNRILSAFRKPLEQLSADKQRAVRQNFHLAVSELRLDISARISEVKLYDRLVFERSFRLEWQDTM